MNQTSAPHFAPPAADLPCEAPAAPGAQTTMHTRESLLWGLGSRLDSVAVIQRQQAASEARVVVQLAAAARQAHSLGRLPGASLEHARRSLVAEAATTLLIPEATAARRINEAETLCECLPATLEALWVGEISYRHAQAMVTQARTLPESARAEFETVALPAAATQTSAQFAAHARRLRERMHPDSIDQRHREAREGRSVWVEKECDGMATLICHLPAVAAFAIDDTLDQLARSLRGADEVRTHAQLRTDGLVDLLLDREGDTAEKARGIRANIAVAVPVMTLLGRSDEAAELRGYGPIDNATARRLTAEAPSLLRILTDPITGQRLSVGRDRYKIPADLRAAVVLDDEICRFPGCTRPADRCDLDHTVDWARGGETSLSNLAALCRRHHTVKHQTDWQVRPGPGRALRWTSPSGAEHATRPPVGLQTSMVGPPEQPPF